MNGTVKCKEGEDAKNTNLLKMQLLCCFLQLVKLKPSIKLFLVTENDYGTK